MSWMGFIREKGWRWRLINLIYGQASRVLAHDRTAGEAHHQRFIIRAAKAPWPLMPAIPPQIPSLAPIYKVRWAGYCRVCREQQVRLMGMWRELVPSNPFWLPCP